MSLITICVPLQLICDSEWEYTTLSLSVVSQAGRVDKYFLWHNPQKLAVVGDTLQHTHLCIHLLHQWPRGKTRQVNYTLFYESTHCMNTSFLDHILRIMRKSWTGNEPEGLHCSSLLYRFGHADSWKMVQRFKLSLEWLGWSQGPFQTRCLDSELNSCLLIALKWNYWFVWGIKVLLSAEDR